MAFCDGAVFAYVVVFDEAQIEAWNSDSIRRHELLFDSWVLFFQCVKDIS